MDSEILQQIDRLLVKPMLARLQVLEARVAALESTVKNGLSERISRIEANVAQLLAWTEEEDEHDKLRADRRWQLRAMVWRALIVIAAASLVGLIWRGLLQTLVEGVGVK